MTENVTNPQGEGARADTPKIPSISQLKAPSKVASLARFSLINQTEELDAMIAKQKPLLGGICLTTQATVLYARPNTGKTLITLALLRDAVGTGRIDGSKCYYIDADDNPAGVLEKQKLLKPYGVHLIAPGLNDFSSAKLRAEIEHMILTDEASGTLLVLDTLKKFADLMSKSSSSDFADLARRYILTGGTLVGLAHTNKRTEKDGRPIYAGTSDILDDFDCAYTIAELPQTSMEDERVVQFNCLKRRGDVLHQVAYRYSLKEGLSYVELVDTVREVDADDLELVHIEAEQERDADAISAIEDCLREGITSKQELKCEAAKRARIGRHKISEVIDRYTGAVPPRHRWDYGSFGHGKREYRLLGLPPGPLLDPEEIYD